MCEEEQYDNTQFSKKLGTELCGAKNGADKQCSPKKPLCGNKRKRSLLRILSVFSNIFLEEQQEKEGWKAADTYTASTRYWLRNVT